MKQARLRFWLAMMDVCYALGLFGRAPYLWCLSRASDCVDWSEP